MPSSAQLKRNNKARAAMDTYSSYKRTTMTHYKVVAENHVHGAINKEHPSKIANSSKQTPRSRKMVYSQMS